VKAPEPLVRLAATVRDLFGTGGHPIPHYLVLEREYELLHGQLPEGYVSEGATPEARLHRIHAANLARRHAALCLSGGGIRSASFALGTLQGLARRHLLSTFDYVSTVSGGGYTGGWLSAWLFHAHAAGHPPERVFDALAGVPTPNVQPEAEPIRRIREYSNYLDPKVGLLSMDVWSLIATIARNLLLNWLVLLPLIAAALLVPRVYYAITMLGTQDWIDRERLIWWSEWLLLVGFGLLAIALVYIVRDLPSLQAAQGGADRFIQFCFVPLAMATAAFTLYWAWSRGLDARPVYPRNLMVLGAGVHFSIWLIAGLLGKRRPQPLTLIAALTSGAVAGAGVWWFAVNLFALPLAHGELFASVAVPLMLALLGGAGTLFVGIASSETTDEDREWWSRFGAWLLITITSWVAVSALIFVGPHLLDRATAWFDGTVSTPFIGKALVALVTALTGGLAARTGRETHDDPSTISLWRRVVFALAAPAFVVMLLVVLASANLSLLRWFDGLDLVPEYAHPDGAGLPETILLIVLLAAAGFLMGMFVAVNKFSLHGMYRNRLIQAFLGASRPAAARRPNRFTGFDPDDNLYLKDLAARGRPLHVVNMALNLVADNRLAWQERKAESFTVTALAAGNPGLGYRPIAEYGGASGMSLGTAITISGAAASPNMGYHSSPAITFLLTLFNARLGAWLGNPGEAGRLTWRRSDPVAGAGPLIREMFGRTTDANPYVYLSDGGHFENFGLYEMVARRCRFIVVADAACDADYAFEDLGNAIRKIRIDLGIAIDFPNGVRIGPPHRPEGNAHGAVGVIRYSRVDEGAEDGALLYVKATLSGDEPIDVANYAAAHRAFPHESTANQWFGESQFESYRVLSLHSLDSLAGSYDGSAGLAGLFAVIGDRLGATHPTASPSTLV
jgi:patatin-like phospholipase